MAAADDRDLRRAVEVLAELDVMAERIIADDANPDSLAKERRSLAAVLTFADDAKMQLFRQFMRDNQIQDDDLIEAFAEDIARVQGRGDRLRRINEEREALRTWVAEALAPLSDRERWQLDRIAEARRAALRAAPTAP